MNTMTMIEPTIEPAVLFPDMPLVAARILVADDEPRIRGAIRACLELEGYDIREARDGRSAFAQVVEHSPDVLILDLAMPELDGLSLLRLMHDRLDPGKSPRTIVLTAYGSISAAASAEQYGAVGFLEKPLIPDTLRQAIASALRDQPARRRIRIDVNADEPPLGPNWFG